MRISKYAGQYYERGRAYEPTKGHNAVSWAKVDRAIGTKDKLHYDDLVSAAFGHKSGTKKAPGPASFIRYLIRRDKLRLVVE